MGEKYNDLSHLALPPRASYEDDHLALTLSPSFYRQAQNRQVFRLPNPYRITVQPSVLYQSRFSHSQTVFQIATNLADELGLNRAVTLAGALGHDMGHIAKGHLGEKWITERFQKEFLHENFALVVLEEIEKLKLSLPVKQCIAYHSWDGDVLTNPNLPECCRIVAIADKFYLVFDAYDTIGILKSGTPKLPYSKEERSDLIDELETMIRSFYPAYKAVESKTSGFMGANTERWQAVHYIEQCVIDESLQEGRVSFSQSNVAQHFVAGRKMMIEKVYKKADNPKLENGELDQMFEYIEQNFVDYDPLLILVLLDDLQIQEANLAWQTNDLDVLYDLHFDIVEIIGQNRLPKKDERQIDIFAKPNFSSDMNPT